MPAVGAGCSIAGASRVAQETLRRWWMSGEGEVPELTSAGGYAGPPRRPLPPDVRSPAESPRLRSSRRVLSLADSAAGGVVASRSALRESRLLLCCSSGCSSSLPFGRFICRGYDNNLWSVVFPLWCGFCSWFLLESRKEVVMAIKLRPSVSC